MKIPKSIAILVVLSALFLNIGVAAEAKLIKAGASVSKFKKGPPPDRKKVMATPLFKEAYGYFSKKNYARAMDCFQTLDATGYCCDTVHYYIAQCYQNTNQTVAASMHYSWVMEKSKDPTLRRYADYANQCLAYYSGHRTYSGQGNNFARNSSGGYPAGGGGGGVRFG
ncbi:MAG TPA: hypothetical protein V6C76_02940 [Drouetiella sp.]